MPFVGPGEDARAFHFFVGLYAPITRWRPGQPYLMETQRKRVLVAMSGGVDSSVAALLLVRQGYEVIGFTMRLADAPEAAEDGKPRSCCSVEDVGDARAVANQLGVPFYAGHYKDEFQKYVIDYFVGSYRKGLTPNPCAKCNEHLKFDFLLQRAEELGCDYLATGHYARIDHSSGRPQLLRGLDSDKDQTYFIFTLSEEAMERVLFPVGEFPKDDVRALAESADLPVARKPDSQEICFIPSSGYQDFVERRIGKANPGKIVDEHGNVLGEHQGLWGYTIGQRRGLGVGGRDEPLYVVRLDTARNAVVVGSEDRLKAKAIRVRVSNLASDLGSTFVAQTQIRYRHTPAPARVQQLESGAALVEFDEPQRAPTPGQAAVFYEGDRVLGGGWIAEVVPL